MSAARPVTIDGVEYSSITAAAKALGLPMQKLYTQLRLQGMEPRPSVANAALRAGVCPSTVYAMVRRGIPLEEALKPGKRRRRGEWISLVRKAALIGLSESGLASRLRNGMSEHSALTAKVQKSERAVFAAPRGTHRVAVVASRWLAAEEMKALGARWNEVSAAWLVPSSREAAAREIAARVARKTSRRSGEKLMGRACTVRWGKKRGVVMGEESRPRFDAAMRDHVYDVWIDGEETDRPIPATKVDFVVLRATLTKEQKKRITELLHVPCNPNNPLSLREIAIRVGASRKDVVAYARHVQHEERRSAWNDAISVARQ